MGHPSALKRKGALTRAAAWARLKDIELSETSQLQRRQIPYNPLIEVPRTVKLIEKGRRMVAARGWRWGRGVSV